VDTGIESTHPDLISKIFESWVAPGINEGPGDLFGHGTHVAGIAAAVTNNGMGISGVGIDTLVGSLKACKITGICEDWDIEAAILHAIEKGYHVINMSFGGPDPGTLGLAVNEALAAGLVLVSSAGNDYSFDEPSYPAAFDGVIAVAATDHYDNLASFSNFGQWVEVAAPGVNILSTYPGMYCGDADCYTWMSGTSMASPIVSGAAALVFASIGGDDPILSSTLRSAVIDAILNNADHTGALGQNMLAWTQYGRLNLYAALTGGGENIAPVADFTYNCNDLTCNFDASSSNDPDGSIVSYAWTFGDGYVGSGITATHAYLNMEDYTVTLTVTDDGSPELTDTDTAVVSVTEEPTLVMHVASIAMDLNIKDAGKNTFLNAIATVNIVDANGSPVEGATVYGSWSDATYDIDSGITGTDGNVRLISDQVKNAVSETTFTFTVDDVVKSTGTYDSSSNTKTVNSINVP